jgi:transcriptional regulator with XRE-family HTH domain
MLAGVSVDYYTRLEQGRETNPSVQVIDALAHALDFDLSERRYAYALAGIAWKPDLGGLPATIPAPLARMIDAWPDAACFVLDPLLDIVVMNRLAATLFQPFSSTQNLVEMVFLDPVGRQFYVDWERAASGCVANLRATSDLYADHPRRAQLLDRLEQASPDFSKLWAAHRVEPKTYDDKTLRHPIAGELTLGFHAFEVAAQPGHQLVVYRAEPATVSAERLASLSAPRPAVLEEA